MLHFYGELIEHLYSCVDYYWNMESLPKAYIHFDLPLKSLVILYQFLYKEHTDDVEEV